MKGLGYVIVLAGCLLALVSQEVQARSYLGRNLQASASSQSSAVSEGEGRVSSSSTAAATNGGVAVSDVAARGDGSSDVKASGSAVADEGKAIVEVEAVGEDEADVETEAKAVAVGEGATAVTQQTAEGRGDSKVDAKAMSKAISDGDGEALAIVIKETLADGDEQSVTEAASEAIAEAISTGPAGTTAVANVIATTIADKGESTSLFAKSVGLLIAEKGCEVLKPALVEANNIVTAKGRQAARTFIESISVDAMIVECMYDPCTESRAMCCQSEYQKIGRCGCADERNQYTCQTTTFNLTKSVEYISDPRSCQYRLFWQIPRPSWECASESCSEPRCLCPDA